MYSNTLLKRFVKDYSLPIQVVQEPYFNYFMNLYSNQYRSQEKFKLLQDAVSKFKTEEDFLNEYYIIRDNIINTIKSTDEFKEYDEMKMDKFDVPNKSYPSQNIFKVTNVSKYFMSIDLKKANFQALKWLNPKLVLNCNTYDELLSKFTNLEYMKESKYLRQVIFGNMNPKKNIKIERYMVEQIIDLIYKTTTYSKDDIRMVSSDEIVLEVTKEMASNIVSEDITKLIKDNLDFDVDVEIYELCKIGEGSYFVKEFINKSGYELMSIPLVYHAQVFKKYNSFEVNENDLVFLYENQVCKFINPLSFEVTPYY